MEMKIRLEPPAHSSRVANVEALKRQVRAELERIPGNPSYDETPSRAAAPGLAETLTFTLDRIEEIADAPLHVARLLQALSIAATNYRHDPAAPRLMFAIRLADRDEEGGTIDRSLPLSNQQIVELAEELRAEIQGS